MKKNSNVRGNRSNVWKFKQDPIYSSQTTCVYIPGLGVNRTGNIERLERSSQADAIALSTTMSRRQVRKTPAGLVSPREREASGHGGRRGPPAPFSCPTPSLLALTPTCAGSVSFLLLSVAPCLPPGSPGGAKKDGERVACITRQGKRQGSRERHTRRNLRETTVGNIIPS